MNIKDAGRASKSRPRNMRDFILACINKVDIS